MSSTKTAERLVLLLRGVNVGGHNKLPMKTLAELLESIGCTDVETYIQSGNAVVSAKPTLAAQLANKVSHELDAQLGLKVPVVVRTVDELRRVTKINPFLNSGGELSTLHVGFLADHPRAANVAALDLKRSPPDAFDLQDREIYLMCPNGLGRTKLTNAYFDAVLETTTTIRNWRTVLTLLQMAEAQ